MRFLVPIITLFLALTASAAQYQKPFGQLKEQQKFKDYTVRIYQDTNRMNGCFEVLKSGKRVFFKEGQFFAVGDVTPESGHTVTNSIKMGQSITSEKQPNLLVTEWTSGNHCCNTFYVFEIGKKFKLIANIDAEYFEISEFRDLRGDGNLELVTADFTFAYWHVGCCFSHSPTIILTYQNGRYLPDLEKMKKMATTEKQLQDWANEYKAKFVDAVKDLPDDKWAAPYEMWQKMLNLIYTGNMNSAWRLCDLSWPANHPGKSIFLKEFIKQLQTSPYYQDINQASFQGVAVQKKDMLKCSPNKVKLVGTFKDVIFPGPPDYKSVAKGDAPEDYWILKLEKPIDVEKDPDYPVPDKNRPQLNQRELQINLDVYLAVC